MCSKCFITHDGLEDNKNPSIFKQFYLNSRRERDTGSSCGIPSSAPKGLLVMTVSMIIGNKVDLLVSCWSTLFLSAGNQRQPEKRLFPVTSEKSYGTIQI